MNSVFLAEFLGLYMTVVSAVFMIKKESFERYLDQFVENTSMRYNIAFFELAVGIAVILTHNIWSLNYKGVITIFGWFTFLEAVFHLYATDEQERNLINLLHSDEYWKIFGSISLFLGAYLATKGFTGF